MCLQSACACEGKHIHCDLLAINFALIIAICGNGREEALLTLFMMMLVIFTKFSCDISFKSPSTFFSQETGFENSLNFLCDEQYLL